MKKYILASLYCVMTLVLSAHAEMIYLCEDGSKVIRTSQPAQVKLVDYAMVLKELEFDQNNPDVISRYTGKGKIGLAKYRNKDKLDYASFIVLNDTYKTPKMDARLVLASIDVKEDKLASASNYACKII